MITGELIRSDSSDMTLAAHIGTPGLGMYCAAGWALEGFCDVGSVAIIEMKTVMADKMR